MPLVRSLSSYSGVSDGDTFSTVFGTKIDELSSSNSECKALDRSLVPIFSEPCKADRLSASLASLNSAFWRIVESLMILSSTSTRRDSSGLTRGEATGFWTSSERIFELSRSSVSA